MSTTTRRPPPMIGQVLRERRGHHGWTLADVAEKTGISKSTLSKIENDLISPSYQTIIQLCAGLDIEIGDLLSPNPVGDEAKQLMGRRSVSRQHEGLVMEDDNYRYVYLCTDIAHKRIVPMVIDVTADSLNRVEGLWTHVGEEYLYVLKGSITLYTSLYEDTVLETGDSVYFDSTMGHAYIAAGDAPAQLLVMCSSATPNLAQTLREMLKQRLTAKID
ncbi:XRE family transcriptional regulator [Rhizobium sp. BK060]|uniref:helix-turn-helix domain-containing protein n=1 Tax=Rhizobium sp. BK060 TaxID=2587096 RepID=UPI001610DAF2|nr:XRE family transcriptional regulator [Rhizobium sp. BK060]MBB3394221.1 transcriptional regulator with XRE-family HTH domain [Rhizobium sp. BK060]